jgi:CBS-domain-containing membrane protein
MLRKELYLAPVLEAALILAVALVGWATHQPFIFASLGPTAYEMIEMPKRPSAHPYNIIAGNLIAVIAAFAALYVTGAWSVASVSAHGVPLPRVWAAMVAALLTVFGTLLARASQPAALSTTLLISLGIMQTWQESAVIMGAVLLITMIGEPLRRIQASSSRD